MKNTENKWYSINSSDPDPQPRSTIYFIPKDGGKYAGTYSDSQFISLSSKCFEKDEVTKWMIRDDYRVSKGEPLEESVEYKDYIIVVSLKSAPCFYWQSIIKDHEDILPMKKATKIEALNAMKTKIDEMID
ncbi:MAG: hypothetical protein WD509_01925 [Candidatus Paceibacterota bacterium]